MTSRNLPNRNEKTSTEKGQESVADALKNVSNSSEQLRSQSEMEFTVAINSLSVLRYITDAISTAPLTAVTRILKDHDIISSLVYLMENAPWLRAHDKDGKFEKFEDGRWKSVSKQEILLLGKVEAQIWLALYNLLLEPECQKKYNYNMHNHEVILRVCLWLISNHPAPSVHEPRFVRPSSRA